LNPLALVAALTDNIIKNFEKIISDVGVLIADFASGQWEKAGATYADILILAVGTLAPRLTHSGITIDKNLSNLHELIPHNTTWCFNPDGSAIPGRCGAPASVKNLTLY